MPLALATWLCRVLLLSGVYKVRAFQVKGREKKIIMLHVLFYILMKWSHLRRVPRVLRAVFAWALMFHQKGPLDYTMWVRIFFVNVAVIRSMLDCLFCSQLRRDERQRAAPHETADDFDLLWAGGATHHGWQPGPRWRNHRPGCQCG
jgi:hypothetical protein